MTNSFLKKKINKISNKALAILQMEFVNAILATLDLIAVLLS